MAQVKFLTNVTIGGTNFLTGQIIETTRMEFPAVAHDLLAAGLVEPVEAPKLTKAQAKAAAAKTPLSAVTADTIGVKAPPAEEQPINPDVDVTTGGGGGGIEGVTPAVAEGEV